MCVYGSVSACVCVHMCMHMRMYGDNFVDFSDTTKKACSMEKGLSIKIAVKTYVKCNYQY